MHQLRIKLEYVHREIINFKFGSRKDNHHPSPLEIILKLRFQLSQAKLTWDGFIYSFFNIKSHYVFEYFLSLGKVSVQAYIMMINPENVFGKRILLKKKLKENELNNTHFINKTKYIHRLFLSLNKAMIDLEFIWMLILKYVYNSTWIIKKGLNI